MEESYIVRIYQKSEMAGNAEADQWLLVGTVEEISHQKSRHFHSAEELWRALVERCEGLHDSV